MPRTFRCELPVAVARQQKAHGQTANSPGEGGVGWNGESVKKEEGRSRSYHVLGSAGLP